MLLSRIQRVFTLKTLRLEESGEHPLDITIRFCHMSQFWNKTGNILSLTEAFCLVTTLEGQK